MTHIFRRRPIAVLAAAPLMYMAALAAPAPAAAMQILEAADHGELAAEISATDVNRIALAGDRIAKVVRSPDGFAVEHDAVSGDLYLRPAGVGPVDGEPLTMFVGTERGFTYRLTLIPADRDSAQILIRNGAIAAGSETAMPARAGEPHVAALVRLVRAVARRELLPGYGIEAGGDVSAAGLTLIETWRGPRFAALVFEAGRPPSPGSRSGAGADADGSAGLAGDHRGACGHRARVGPVAGGARHRSLGRASRRRGDGSRRGGRPAMSARNERPSVRDPGEAQAVRRRQLLLFSAVAAVVLAGLAAWLGAGSGTAPAPRGGIDAGIVAPDAAEKVWTRRSEARLGGIETQLRELRQEARSLAAENDRLRARLEADAADARGVIDRQAALIDELRRGLGAPAQPGAAARAPGRSPGSISGRRVMLRRTETGHNPPHRCRAA